MTSALYLFPTQPSQNFKVFFDSSTLGMAMVMSEVPLIDHNRMHDDRIVAVDDWIALLSITTRLIFPKVRERAIKELTSCLEQINPLDLIALAVKYDVPQWLKPAYHRIVIRQNPIEYNEAEKIPFLVTLMLMRSRERCRIGGYNFIQVNRVIDSESKLMDQVSSEPATAGRATQA